MDITPQGYPLVVTIEDEQHLVIGWTSGGTGLVPVTLALGGPGRPQVHDDDFVYTLPPQLS